MTTPSRAEHNVVEPLNASRGHPSPPAGRLGEALAISPGRKVEFASLRLDQFDIDDE